MKQLPGQLNFHFALPGPPPAGSQHVFIYVRSAMNHCHGQRIGCAGYEVTVETFDAQLNAYNRAVLHTWSRRHAHRIANVVESILKQNP